MHTLFLSFHGASVTIRYLYPLYHEYIQVNIHVILVFHFLNEEIERKTKTNILICITTLLSVYIIHRHNETEKHVLSDPRKGI